MSCFSFIGGLRAVAGPSRHAPRKRRPGVGARPGSFRPCLELLENRTLPSTFLVTNPNDSGPGALRAAVGAADSTSGATIDFAANLHGTITLTSGQLDLTSSMTIDGPGPTNWRSAATTPAGSSASATARR
jgi:hypothetical protein